MARGSLGFGIVRSVVADPGLLATTLDLSGGVVPASFGVSPTGFSTFSLGAPALSFGAGTFGGKGPLFSAWGRTDNWIGTLM